MNQPVADFDLLYSSYHKTFLMVYLTRHTDNTFYYRHLQASDPILPPYARVDNPPSDYDYVEEVLKQPWSEEKVLYKADTPPAGNYIYAGSVHAGYFGPDDITQGGKKALLSWTQHTGEDAASPRSGYAHMTARVEFE